MVALGINPRLTADFREMSRTLLADDWQLLREMQQVWQETLTAFDQCRSELSAAQLQLREMQLQADEQRAAWQQQALAEQQTEHAEIVNLRQQLDALDQGRSVLQLELEHARQLNSQQQTELSGVRQQLALAQEMMHQELRQLRSQVDHPAPSAALAHEQLPAIVGAELARHAATQEPRFAVLPGTPVIAAAVVAPREHEVGLNSVLSQFQSLQKDLARRRAPIKKPGA